MALLGALCNAIISITDNNRSLAYTIPCYILLVVWKLVSKGRSIPPPTAITMPETSYRSRNTPRPAPSKRVCNDHRMGHRHRHRTVADHLNMMTANAARSKGSHAIGNHAQQPVNLVEWMCCLHRPTAAKRAHNNRCTLANYYCPVTDTDAFCRARSTRGNDSHPYACVAPRTLVIPRVCFQSRCAFSR